MCERKISSLYAMASLLNLSRQEERSIPSSDKSIFFDVAIPRTLISRSNSLRSLSLSAESWSRSVPPIFPGPKRPTESVCCDKKKTECRALSALPLSSALITALIFLSEDPCAIALIFIPARPRDERNAPAVPTCPGMPSPTAAMIARSLSLSIAEIPFSWISWENSALMVFTAELT